MKITKGSFSITKTIETGENFSRINEVALNVNGSAIASIRYYYVNEENEKTKDSIIVNFFFTDMIDYSFDCSEKIIAFFDRYIGTVTASEASTKFCHNLFYHMINRVWLVSEERLNELPIQQYYPRTYYAYKYNHALRKTGARITVIIH